VTALLPSLPPGAIPRSSRGGPDRTRRACSAAAISVARGGPPAARAGTRTRTCGGGPCCLLSSLRASAPARGLRMRGNARTGRGGDRDGPSLASHCARAAERERAAHADTDGHASSSSAEVPRVYRAKLAHATAGRARGEQAHQGGGTRSTPATRVAVPRAREHPHSPRLVRWRWRAELALCSRCARAALVLRYTHASLRGAGAVGNPQRRRQLPLLVSPLLSSL
jgi:hypothetical protein